MTLEKHWNLFSTEAPPGPCWAGGGLTTLGFPRPASRLGSGNPPIPYHYPLDAFGISARRLGHWRLRRFENVHPTFYGWRRPWVETTFPSGFTTRLVKGWKWQNPTDRRVSRNPLDPWRRIPQWVWEVPHEVQWEAVAPLPRILLHKCYQSPSHDISMTTCCNHFTDIQLFTGATQQHSNGPLRPGWFCFFSSDLRHPHYSEVKQLKVH